MINFTKFHEEWTKNVDFLLMANFWVWPVLIPQTLSLSIHRQMIPHLKAIFVDCLSQKRPISMNVCSSYHTILLSKNLPKNLLLALIFFIWLQSLISSILLGPNISNTGNEGLETDLENADCQPISKLLILKGMVGYLSVVVDDFVRTSKLEVIWSIKF